jgi:hypothetical protein
MFFVIRMHIGQITLEDWNLVIEDIPLLSKGRIEAD